MAEWAEGKHCSLRIPEGKAPTLHHPPAPTSLSHAHQLLLERDILPPSRELAGCTVSFARPLAALSLAPLHRNYSRAGSPPCCNARQLSWRAEEGSLQLNSPRNLTHNFHLTHNFFAAGNGAGLEAS